METKDQVTHENLMDVIYEFFKKLGIKILRFKPTYKPYTEPPHHPPQTG